MTILMSDQKVTQRILEHIEKGTTDLSDDIWREPVANYRSGDRLAAEINLLRRLPVPFCPSAALAEAGAYIAREAAGTPIIVVRGQDGAVRAFRNACRHRGMLVATGSGCTKAFVCRYHGWTYRLDGSLSHIPHEYGFPDLDKATHGLVSVPAVERSGLVFVAQDGDIDNAGVLDTLPDLIGPQQKIFARTESETEANWKIVAEGFLEGYHIRSTHRDTFYPYGFDNLNVIEQFGRNSRVTFPFRRIAKLADVPPERRRVDGLLTYVYHLFPNVMIAVLSQHTKVVLLEPVSIDRTRLITFALSNIGSSDSEQQEAVARDAAFVDQTGAAEDRDVTCAIQRGIGSGANTVFTYGRFEGAIAHFHRSLDAALATGS
ncbi:aromatic ring-hydroxylating dioxygenase subunit alpha [Reyranella sp. CPCC 100927]|uniref:aromatic ring-hydroxylating oxygenase subunit alpha n=1 Tax=Reyranella sp. CPCC 100927 TaxID=2599616 RepID=UPI0011B3EF35|nr:SRPBCC family protein [Reyranella sp. CPCC 100927]TWT11813.1 Rieske 2Fe-2S domain-containing protein [Reyranella sp. CPCC 100927]